MTVRLAFTASLPAMEHNTTHYFNARVRDEIWSWPGDVLADYAWVIDAVTRFGIEPWIPRLRRATWGGSRGRGCRAMECQLRCSCAHRSPGGCWWS